MSAETTPARQEWAAEHVVDADTAARLIDDQFPDLRGASVELLAEGWDNTVHRVSGVSGVTGAGGEGGMSGAAGEWAFRFPRRGIALAGVAREIELMPRLAPSLPLPVPVPELVGSPGHGYPWLFFGARLLPGRELADAGLPDARRIRLATALGGFLRALHRPAIAESFRAARLPVDPMSRAQPGARAPIARERLDRLLSRGTWAGDDAVDDLLTGSLRLGPSTADPVLAHGDLHVRHVLVDEEGGCAGVIDWGDLCLADPCVDLSVAYGAFSGGARSALLTAYGRPLAPDQEIRARVLAVFLCAALADYADVDGRPALLAESLAGLRRAVMA